ncbi:MAG: glycosyltransferase [Candidatus Delongbacteria bacterium]|nr:glycosyltransferase [Candidatus Delongbacteria bacterium]MDD4204500.1 glycosyltransferase [Candidatus Delongbacteria bacterium]
MELIIGHIDTGIEWRGGQQQAAYLHEGLLKKGYKSILFCKPDSSFEKYLKSNALPYKTFKMLGELDIISAFNISVYCRKHKINILHLHSAHALTIGLLVKFFFHKIRIIGVRRVDFHLKNNFFSNFKYKNRFLDKIVTVSDGVKRVLLEDGVDENKIITIYDGVDINKFRKLKIDPKLKETLGIEGNVFLIGTVAALTGHKDYPNLLNAAKIVTDKINNVIFCAYGNGQKEEEIKELASKLKLGNKFIFAGFRKDVGQFLKICDIFVLASKLEGLGSSILDAMSVGLPVVGTNTGGIPEIIKHNENGLLVEKENHEKLAEAIISLINDENKRKLIGINSFEYVKEFDIDKYVEKNIKLYEKLLGLN